MLGESTLSRSQLKGHLFELVLLELLCKNGLCVINVVNEPRDRVRENREGFIELKGRACWHQIDCPCDYNQLIPFLYPLRLLGEAKFYKNPLDKKNIRTFIGLLKDIQENYFLTDSINLNNAYPRKMEIGVFFAANGFQEEAEKLAYAHGIKTISYANNYLIDRIKDSITILEKNFLSVECMKENNWLDFKREFADSIFHNHHWTNHLSYWSAGYQDMLKQLREQIVVIQSNFIGTTSTGVYIHFIGDSPFPAELFKATDEGWCRVFYDSDNYGKRYFWMEIDQDPYMGRYFFTPPESLDEAAVFGNEIVLGEKVRLFHTLTVSTNINGISRNLILHIDRDWIELLHRRRR